MGGVLVGGAQVYVTHHIAGHQAAEMRATEVHARWAAEAGERRAAEVHARWAAEAGERRAAEARAHEHQKLGREGEWHTICIIQSIKQ